ncbi:MAG: hypothetical protein KJZ83_23715 [Burkholderiaceae bacterium]|nr:hypothetical protein [Burkholderiaceae bacterium]
MSTTIRAAQPAGSARARADNPSGPSAINGYPVHPYANLFPMFSDADIDALAGDILEHGLREPIWLYMGAIVDGRNRAEACRRAGRALAVNDTVQFNGTDDQALGFVVSKNLLRRHLTVSQRAMIAAEICNLMHGGNRKSTTTTSSSSRVPDQAAPVPLDRPGAVTQAQAAEAMKVSERTVRDAVSVKKADPVLADQVRAGKVPVKKAAAQVRGEKAPAKKPNPTTAPKLDADKLLERISADMAMLTERSKVHHGQYLKAGMLAAALIKRISPKLDQSELANLMVTAFENFCAEIPGVRALATCS